MNCKLRTIAVSEQNYLGLKSLGRAGDSFNDVVTQLLRKELKDEKNLSQIASRVGSPSSQSAIVDTKTTLEGDSDYA
jgi:predicted CopG family antitoxin